MRFIKSVMLTLFASLIAFGLASQPAKATPILIIDSGGTLLGADNVDLGGLGVFKVRLFDRTCADLFSGCDNAAEDFDFQTFEDALTAAEALLSVIFQFDGGFSEFRGADTTTLNGCTNNDGCQIRIPFEIGLFTRRTGEIVPELNGASAHIFFSDLAPFSAARASRDLGTPELGSINFAKFSKIPEPPAFLLIGFGLLGLAGIRRHRQQERLGATS